MPATSEKVIHGLASHTRAARGPITQVLGGESQQEHRGDAQPAVAGWPRLWA